MNHDDDTHARSDAEKFATAGADRRASFASDYLHFLKRTKKWWLVPLVLILLVFGGLLILAGTGGAPFIYALF
jgi:hypothetical protein